MGPCPDVCFFYSDKYRVRLMQSAFLSRGLWCMLGGFFCRCKLKPEQANNNNNKEKKISFITQEVCGDIILDVLQELLHAVLPR